MYYYIMDEEIWKQINDYPNYSVSNLGNVRNDKTGLILKGRLRGKGYYSVALYNGDGKQNNKSTHRLVAEAFIDNIEVFNQVDHIDNNKLNNNLTNLRWTNNSLNQRNVLKYKRPCSSKYKGVSYNKSSKKYKSCIMINCNSIYLGSFNTEEEAGRAYNNYIINNNLEFFVLNDL